MFYIISKNSLNNAAHNSKHGTFVDGERLLITDMSPNVERKNVDSGKAPVTESGKMEAIENGPLEKSGNKNNVGVVKVARPRKESRELEEGEIESDEEDDDNSNTKEKEKQPVTSGATNNINKIGSYK